MSFPFMIGSMVTSHRGRAMALGFTLHLGFGVVFALLYALVFEQWQWSPWWLGGLLGVFHGLFILVVLMPMLPDLHPRMASKHHGPTPTRQLEPPGFMALNYGRNTPALTLVAHVAYGVLLGAFY
jgi:Na+-transporting methylmalonyl-CoA/oxaloacetate decarboxylase gamma subunit